LGISACPPCRSPSLHESANGLHVRFECVSDCDAELIKETLPISIANDLQGALRIGGRQRVIPLRAVDELLDDALPILGETLVVEREDPNRCQRSGMVGHCRNFPSEIETKAVFAHRMKRRHKLCT